MEAKCKAYGVPIVFVNPKGTSKSCPICGSILRGQDKRCPTCGLSRHYVAAMNIACRGIEKFPSLSGLGQGVVSAPCSLSSGSTECGGGALPRQELASVNDART
ncbi:MAG: zinc ribbon domain-containing protein [Armatimonadota bacterium]